MPYIINLNQSKAFDRLHHGFLEAVLSAAGFGLQFRCWVRLYAFSRSECDNIEAFHIDSVGLSRFFALTHVVRLCA